MVEIKKIQPILFKPKKNAFDLPGSKSITNRALLIAALADGKTILKNALFSDDTIVAINALKKLGIRIKQKKYALEIYGNSGNFREINTEIYLKNAGTAVRFLTALSSILKGKLKINGDERMQKRPQKELISCLKKMGTEVECLKKDGFLPIKINNNAKFQGGKIEISGEKSSQYLSGILMIAPYFPQKTTIIVKNKLVSKPYIDLTLKVMADFGIKIKNDNYKKFIIKNGLYKAQNYKIEGDASSATYLYGIAAVSNCRIQINNLGNQTKQADNQILPYLKKMGCKIVQTKNKTEISGPKKLKKLGDINLEKMPDGAITLAVLAAISGIKTEISGLSTLKHKECDRITALEKEFRKLGLEVNSDEKSITISGRIKNGAIIETYSDHRIAMAFSIIGTKYNDIEIKNPDCVNKTYPQYWKDLDKFYQNKIIALSGLRGSGKTTLGEMLARKLNYSFIDLDKYIEKNEKKEIKQIVKEKGWQYFRLLEEKYLKKALINIKQGIIALGGGTIMSNINYKHLLKKKAIIILLNCNLTEIKKRLQKDKKRPPLLGDNFLSELNQVWQKRKKNYKKRCDFAINTTKTNHKSLIFSKIIDKINNLTK